MWERWKRTIKTASSTRGFGSVGAMSADKRAEAIRRLVEVKVNPAGRGTKIFDPSKVEFTWK